jgi:T5SS/PEP-CTERM-associated repeat protein
MMRLRSLWLGVPALALALAATVALAAHVVTGNVSYIDLLSLGLGPWSNVLLIGANGEGAVSIDGGTQVDEDSAVLGALAGGDGTLTVSGAGSQLTAVGDPVTHAAAVVVGNAGQGTAQVLAGGVIEIDGSDNQAADQAAAFALGVESAGVGNATVSGAGSLVQVHNGAAEFGGLAVGVAGQGTLLVDQGGAIEVDTGTAANNGASLGVDAGSTGTMTVTGPDSRLELTGLGTVLSVGLGGDGTLVLDDGGSASAQIGIFALEATSTATVQVGPGAQIRLEGSNPRLGYGGALQIGCAGAGSLEITDGSVGLSNLDGSLHGLQIGGVVGCGGPCAITGGTGSVLVDGVGGEFRVLGPNGGASIGADGSGSLTVSGGALFAIENPDGISGTSVGLSPGAAGTVLVTGAGSTLDAGISMIAGLDLAFADAGTATVTVADGGQLTAADAIYLGADATLGGDGTIAADVENLRGTIAPGTSIGALAVQGAVNQAGGRLRLEVLGTAADAADRLSAQGPIALTGGDVRIELDPYLFLPEVGDEVVVASSPAGVTVGPAVTTSYAGAAPGFTFELAVVGNDLVLRAQSAAESFGACQASQLKAFAKLCDQRFACEAKRAKKPEKDPTSTKLGECLAKADTAFGKAFDKAAAKAAKKGELCGLGGTAADAALRVSTPAAAVADAILAGVDEADSEDDALRAALLGQAGDLCSRLLQADAKQIQKPDAEKRAASRTKAGQTFDTKTAKALDKATQKGVVYDGAGPSAIAVDTDALAAEAARGAAGL